MTIEDFRPCVCGHAKYEHGEPLNITDHAGKSTCRACGWPATDPILTACGCAAFESADEPYIDIAIKSEWYEGSTIEWGGIEPENVSRVDHGRSTTLTVRLRPSDIAFADWKRKQAKP